MMLDDRDSSYEISPLNRIKDEYPFFIIEIAGEPISNERATTIIVVRIRPRLPTIELSRRASHPDTVLLLSFG
jgi:hypothetical protein